MLAKRASKGEESSYVEESHEKEITKLKEKLVKKRVMLSGSKDLKETVATMEANL